MLEARRGRVVEDPGVRPLPGADVFQVYWRRGRVGEPPKANAVRWTLADREGAFAFAVAKQDSSGGRATGRDAVEYGFFHPDFGLVRAGSPGKAGELVLRGRALDEAGRQASQLELCGSRPVDAVHAGVAQRHCRPRSR